MNVGIRELKAHLSEYLGRARRGETVVVTDRGRPVARLEPYHGGDVPAHVHQLAEAGLLHDKGRPATLPQPIALRPGNKTAVDYVREQRR